MIKANYKFAEQKAKEQLLKLNINTLPVDLDKIVNSFPDLRLFSYTFFAERFNFTIEETIILADSKSGCCFYDPELNKHIILYNDTINNTGHIRWTIAHELGHYILNHHNRTNKTLFARNSLSEKEYKILETEANCFSRELLAPPPVLRTINIADPYFISEVCNISQEAARYVHNFLVEGSRKGIIYSVSNPIRSLFSGFIFKTKYAKYCNNCGFAFSKEIANYCPVCGSDNNSINSDIKFTWRRDTMKYKSISLDAAGRAKSCPNCENEEVKGEYCKICGAYLINKCTGLNLGEYNSGDPFESRIHWHSHEAGCGELLEGNARHCTKCGSTSTFYEEGILQYWGNEQNGRDLATVSDINSEDLPF